MRDSIRKLLLIVLLALGFCLVARADYESQQWAFGESPHRFGIVGINDEWTRICVGEERGYVDGAFGPFTLHINPIAFVGIASALTAVPIVLVALFFRRRHRHRHDNAA